MRPRQQFDQQLSALQDSLVRLSEMVCQAVSDAIKALKERDLDLARLVVQRDSELNDLRFDVDERCLAILATQQPTASDLRRVIAAMNVVLDLERMGDHAANVAKIAIRIGDEPPLKPLIDIPYMARQCCDMLRRSLVAYADLDVEAAKAIAEQDGVIDQLYDQVFRELLTYMIEDERTVKRAMHLLFIAHNLERIADRVTNICERAIYLRTGEMIELKDSLQ
ncbi:MAG: phosphate signaling complex protein PhoU [Anaerolineae bacterium]|nr:phosphate signaling complex protein PhoU [Anaerolineae bacterium]